jgi:23S rRNA (adenine2503-C2)-methyltransferase
MGMGEPLANLQAVSNAVDVLVDPQLRGWSPRRITVSTIGLTGRIYEAAGRWPKVGLALSLHFTTTALRQKHMPAAEAEVTLLADALACYRQDNGGKITIEYSLLAGLNDGVEDLERLAAIARLEGTGASARGEDSTGSRLQSLPLPVNLIEYNPAPALGSYRPSPVRVLESFAAGLSNAGVPVTVRHSRGADIAAACGMLGAESGPQCGKAGGG